VLRQRLLTALIGIPFGLAVIYLGGWYLIGVVMVMAAAGLGEFYGLARRVTQGLTGRWAGCGVSVVLGLVYVPLLFSYLPRLRALEPDRVLSGLPAGALWLFLVVGATWVMDIAAYGVGKAMGRHKLAPTISPGKTVEGAIGALLGAVAATWPMGRWLGLSTGQAVLLGTLLGIGGQVGDLFESWLKRRAGVKDSGAVLPGHGGVLDRFDSLLFNAPIAYYFLRAVIG
jgi:phosphatidate cytidylyltransferase